MGGRVHDSDCIDDAAVRYACAQFLSASRKREAGLLGRFRRKPTLLVMFICNHCPFVLHIRETLTALCRTYQAKGVGFVAINSNDATHYPEDSPVKMKEYAEQYQYPFPYLVDATQEVAKAYSAACTPDFFLFEQRFRLAYRGQFDDSRPGNNEPVTGKDLTTAIDALLTGATISMKQKPSMGCNIKWKPGNEPPYASP